MPPQPQPQCFCNCCIHTEVYSSTTLNAAQHRIVHANCGCPSDKLGCWRSRRASALSNCNEPENKGRAGEHLKVSTAAPVERRHPQHQAAAAGQEAGEHRDVMELAPVKQLLPEAASSACKPPVSAAAGLARSFKPHANTRQQQRHLEADGAVCWW
jgi:hypothetical protein